MKRFRNSVCLLFGSSALLAGVSAQAVNISAGNRHADILPYATSGTVATGYYDYDLEQVVQDTRLFVREMEFAQSTFYGTTNPGFTTLTGYTLPASADLSFTVPTLQGSDSVQRNLLYWDGEGAVDFGSVMAGEDLLLRRSSALNTVLDGSGAPASGFSIDTANASGQIHNHISFSARGTGGAPPADGFYLFAMQFEAGGLMPSVPIYMLFNADYERSEQGQILYNGDRPIVNKASEQLAIDWAVGSFLSAGIPGDADGDGDVDDSDLGTAFSNYTGPVGAAGGKDASQGDADGDGDVDDSDLGTAFSAYTGPIAVSVPEPGSIAACVLLAAGGLFGRRRRAVI